MASAVFILKGLKEKRRGEGRISHEWCSLFEDESFDVQTFVRIDCLLHITLNKLPKHKRKTNMRTQLALLYSLNLNFGAKCPDSDHSNGQ
jgi:hypothetical protein